MEGRHEVLSVEYEGSFEDGTVFDSSSGGGPLEFLTGTGSVIPGFEKGIIGMGIGEQKKIIIPPEEGYGPARPELIITLGRGVLEGVPNPVEGMEIVATLESGQQVPVRIVRIDDKNATLDFNHPLAGKTLIFKVKLLGKRSATEEELEHGHAHGNGYGH